MQTSQVRHLPTNCSINVLNIGKTHANRRDYLKMSLSQSETHSNLHQHSTVIVKHNVCCVAVVMELEDGFVFDYRLTRPPRITNDFIETSHKVYIADLVHSHVSLFRTTCITAQNMFEAVD